MRITGLPHNSFCSFAEWNISAERIISAAKMVKIGTRPAKRVMRLCSIIIIAF